MDKSKKKANQCQAIKTYNARPKAWEDIQKGNNVFMMYYYESGKMKEKLVSQCGGYGACEGKYCKNHLKTKNIIDIDRIETFFETHKEDIVIHPKSKDEITFKKMINSDPHFVNMAVQGNTKKIKSTVYDFKNFEDPILLILNDRDPRLKDELRLFAIEKLQASNKLVKKDNDEAIEKVEIQKGQDNKLAEKLKKMTLENENQLSDDEFSELSDQEDEKNSNHHSDDEEEEDNQKEKNDNHHHSDSELDSDNEIIAEEDDEDECHRPPTPVMIRSPKIKLENIKCQEMEEVGDEDDDSAISAILIQTKKGKELYLDPNTQSVIEPEGENEGDIIGRLIETPKKYATIEKDNKFWTVISKLYFNDHKKDYLYDVLNYRLFDDEYKCIGRVFKNKQGDFQFKFSD